MFIRDTGLSFSFLIVAFLGLVVEGWVAPIRMGGTNSVASPVKPRGSGLFLLGEITQSPYSLESLQSMYFFVLQSW